MKRMAIEIRYLIMVSALRLEDLKLSDAAVSVSEPRDKKLLQTPEIPLIKKNLKTELKVVALQHLHGGCQDPPQYILTEECPLAMSSVFCIPLCSPTHHG